MHCFTVKVCPILLTMNWGVHYCVNYFVCWWQRKMKSMQKNCLCTVGLTGHGQTAITYDSCNNTKIFTFLLLRQIQWYLGFNHSILPSLKARYFMIIYAKFTQLFYIENLGSCNSVRFLQIHAVTYAVAKVFVYKLHSYFSMCALLRIHKNQ